MNCKPNFGDSKSEYKKYRPTYPKELFELILKSGIIQFYKKAVDLGAGTGISTRFLSNCFEEVYLVEPDAKMLADIEFPINVKVFNCVAEDFYIESEHVEVVTAGNSFYWMDGEVVIKNIYNWLKPNGVFAAYRYNFPQAIPEVQALLDLELQSRWNQFRDKRLIDTEYSLRTVKNSQLFSKVTVRKVSNIVNLSAEELVGFLRSTSYGSAYIKTLEHQTLYINSLIESIKKAVDKNIIPVDFSLELIIAVK